VADWIPAPDTDFWIEGSNTVYLGNGEWALTARGAKMEANTNNPVLEDGKSIWGIRFSWTGSAGDLTGFTVSFNSHGDVGRAASSPVEALLSLSDRDTGEYIYKFGPSSGSWYGNNDGYADVIISNIEIYTDYTELEPSPCRWTSFVGSIEVCE
jgi:hypothetical protein